MPAIEWMIVAIGAYLALGVVMGGFWLLRIAPSRDPALRGSARSVRLLLLPGAVALWPLLIGAARSTGARR